VEGALGLRAWLGLGSNVGDRMANLRAGCDALERDGVRITARSHVYETEPQAGAVGQQDFLNACIEAETELGPRELLDTAKRIEVELGRDPDAPRHSPRPLDIDILQLSNPERIHTDEYRVPHPGLMQRRFVLEPLLELDPPNREDLERALRLKVVQDQRVTRLGTL
jgi:2-amino-4-hydroxy-6-hydroxymethyldihydropteridine diphosphokinase